MSQTEEVFVPKSDFDALVERVDDGFRKTEGSLIEIRRNQARLETSFMELRREQSHHSQLITDLQSDIRELKQGQAELKKENAETRNMVQQILEIVSK
ncbi:hypothetical protein [Endozoicomonas sp. Mp262]|uniref:hypothetical protein n=1 Tax=Endozoicomonas sp. Mp262 TaxID=2919499 RepID=UPI0021DA0D32